MSQLSSQQRTAETGTGTALTTSATSPVSTWCCVTMLTEIKYKHYLGNNANLIELSFKCSSQKKRVENFLGSFVLTRVVVSVPIDVVNDSFP